MLKQKKLADVKKDVVPFYLEKLEAAAKDGHLALGRVRKHLYLNMKEKCFQQIIVNISVYNFS